MSASQPARMTVRCSCQAKLSVPLSAAGRTVKCPKCGELLDVSPAHMELATSGSPAGGAAAASTGAAHTPLPPPAETAERVSVACPCGARLKVRPEAVGKKGKCPRCGDLIVLQVAADEPAEPESESDRGEGDADGPDSLFEQFGDMEGSARAPVAVIGSQPPCPSCGAAVLGGSSECPACGYDRSTGRRGSGAGLSLGALGSTAGGLASGVVGVLGGVAGATGPFLLGILLSAVGGLIGAAIWFGVAMATDTEWALLAWVIGGLAGFGMAAGNRDQNSQAGVAAAVIAALSIVVAKMAIFVFVIYAILTGNTSNIDLQREYVKSRMTDEMLIQQGVDPDAASDAQWDAAYAKVEQRVDELPDAEVRKRSEAYRESALAAAEREGAEEADATASEGDAEEEGATSEDENVEYAEYASGDDGSGLSGFALFFASMFGLFDILFLVLAVGTAYRVAAGGFTS